MTSFHFPTLVLVDPTVSDYQILVNNISSKAEVIILDPTQDGVAQITEALGDRNSIESVHILSHGSSGALQLGSTKLDSESLKNYAKQIQSWAKALAAHANILLYGCSVAAGDLGKSFVRQLSAIAGADIAASTTLTGSAELGGDWKLEFATGEVDTPLVFPPEAREAYRFVLPTLVNESFTGTDVTNQPWVFGVGTASSANPFLTARTDPNPSTGGLPGSAAAPDTVGNGVLRLTNASNDQASFVIYNSGVPNNAGISISFDFFAYGGNNTANPGLPAGADGISFFLIDGTQSPTVAGAFGGSLGYAQKIASGIPGIAGGYVGIGLDEFGNFSNPTDGGGPLQRSGGPGLIPDSVAVRGQGTGTTGYTYLTGTGSLTANGGIDNVGATDRTLAQRRARIDITPAGVLSVNVDLNNDGDFLDTGETAVSGFNIVAANGGTLPASFKFGFASSTGDSTNIHEVRNLVVKTFSSPPTAADVTTSVAPGNTVNLSGLSATDTETSIASFTIVTLPAAAQGTLFLGNPSAGGTAVTAGQTLTPTQVSQLFFQAVPGFTGGSFTYTATDTDGDIDPTPAVATLTVGTNAPPVAQDAANSVTVGSVTSLTGLSATDPDGTIASYTISTLPPAAQGTLYLGNPTTGGTPITVGQGLTPTQITQLFFQPTAGFTGSSFTYTATDNGGATDSTPATVTLSRTANVAPTLPANPTITATPGTISNLTGLAGTDSDGTITSYVISTLPGTDQGTLFLGSPAAGGTPVAVGQTLTAAQIGQLFFQSGSNFTGTTFTYAAVDNTGAVSSPRTVVLATAASVGTTAGCQPGLNLKGNNSKNTLKGGPDLDRLRGRGGNDVLRGKGCDDTLLGGRGSDRLFGNAARDNLQGQQNNDRLDGGKGIDTLNGGLGRDRLKGGGDNDRLFGRRGNDTLNGNAGDDTLAGGRSKDRVRGGNGNDLLDGQQGDDRVDGGKGNDVLNGGLRRDTLLGRQGSESLTGRGGNDRLKGGSQSDLMDGGRGRDILVGGGGADTLIGGAGGDRFVYRNARHGADSILDFRVRQDRIDLSRIFAKPGYSSSQAFRKYVRLGQSGADTVVRIDGNGNTKGGFTVLATLDNVTTGSLTANSFIV
jgi:hypothetical protein